VIKKILIFSLTLLLLVSCGTASLSGASKGVNAHPALWEAKSQYATVYLLGSIHALSPRVKWYGKKISAAFDLSDELVLETAYDEDNAESFKKIDKKYGMLKGGKVISDYLTKVEYFKYKKIVKELNLNQYKADRIKPWLFFLIVGSIVNQKPRESGVDKLFYDAAKAKGLKVSAVETVYQQMKAIALKPFNLQIRNLKDVLNSKKADPKKNVRRRDLLLSWINGDVDRSARLLKIGIPYSEYNSLIIKRNNLWYPKIKSYLAKKQTTMIVVGLAHLIGRGNIIDKLKRSGYKVRRIQ
jgi:uncharacterized protein YbaP (TraB family)